MRATGLFIPTLVRLKSGALDRLGIYLRRNERRRPLLLASEGLPEEFLERARRSLHEADVACRLLDVADGSFEAAVELFTERGAACDAVVGIGGGKALDVAKYVAFLAGQPFYAVPTSLSNDGFCSPQSSLTVQGRRRALRCAMPYGVVVDTGVCQSAPLALWHSGVGDLAAKWTAVADWKLAFHERGTPVNDFAALLSDATVMQLLAHPRRDAAGLRLLATALMLNGVAIEIAQSSRPASGSEHLISHALDSISQRPRLHGLQVGVATYLVSRLQGGVQSERIAQLLTDTGFWDTVRQDPFSRREWLEAVRLAPTLKEDFYTILQHRDCLDDARQLIEHDAYLAPCFR